MMTHNELPYLGEIRDALEGSGWAACWCANCQPNAQIASVASGVTRADDLPDVEDTRPDPATLCQRCGEQPGNIPYRTDAGRIQVCRGCWEKLEAERKAEPKPCKQCGLAPNLYRQVIVCTDGETRCYDCLALRDRDHHGPLPPLPTEPERAAHPWEAWSTPGDES